MEQIDPQRLEVLLRHWQQHNQEHAGSYESWAARLRQADRPVIAEHLEEAARLTREINKVLDRACAELS